MANETKQAAHTPGPWSVHDREHCGARIDGPNGRGVAHATQRDPHPVLGQGITQAEAEANARLIAAAPLLLEALIRVDAALRAAWTAGTLPASVVPGELAQMCGAAIAAATPTP
jgi:hypothetical protein